MRILALAAALPLPAQVPADVDFRLRLENDKTRFHLGEIISVKLLYTATPQEKYSLDRRPPASSEFVVEPVEGTRDPRRGLPVSVGMAGIDWMTPLGANAETLRRDLNEWVRFDEPGRYRITALSRRVWPKSAPAPLELRSNTVEVEILPADPAWQAAELKRAITVLETVLPGGTSEALQQRRAAARTMRFLDTPAAVRQCVRWFRALDVDLFYELGSCLLETKDRKAAVEAMERALGDPLQPIPAYFIQSLAKLKTLLDLSPLGLDPQADPERARWLEESKQWREREMKTLADLTDTLAAAIGQKEGLAKGTSVLAVMDLLTAGKREVPERVKTDLATAMDDLPYLQHFDILGYRWDAVKTAAMIPSLRKIIENPPERRRDLRDFAIRRLFELEPEEGRSRILDDLQRLEPRFGFDVLAMLPDNTLPQVDGVIVGNLVRTRSWIGRELIARYGTKAILPRVRALYESEASRCEPALIGYFLRVDPAYGEVRLREALIVPLCSMRILPQTARYYTGPVWEKLAIEALRDPSVEVKKSAASALGKHGSGAAKNPLFEAFEYWHNWWKDRPNEINAENRFFEQDLARALATGKNWKLEKADFGRLEKLCLTADCKNQARVYAQRPTQ